MFRRHVIGYEGSKCHWCVSILANTEHHGLTDRRPTTLSLIPSTDVIQLTLTLKMTTAQVVEKSVTVSNNSPIQDTTFTRTIILIMILTNVSRSFLHGYVPVELMLPAREATLVLTKFIFR